MKVEVLYKTSKRNNDQAHKEMHHLIKITHLMTKPTKWHVRPAKTQISLGIHPVWSESSLSTHWVAKDPSFLHTDSEDSDQTGRKLSLRWAQMPFWWLCHEAAQIIKFRRQISDDICRLLCFFNKLSIGS